MRRKVMLSFPDEFLSEVDGVAQEEQRRRNELVREALRVYIALRQERGDLDVQECFVDGTFVVARKGRWGGKGQAAAHA